MEKELAGKVAIVTGAGRMRSIGRPIAVELARAGADIVITGTGRPPDRYPDDEQAAGWRDIESVADEVREAGARCLAFVSDVTSEEANADLVRRAVETFGRLDMVINNAAAARGDDRVPVVDLPLATWRRVMTVNVDGTFLLSQAVARHLLKQDEGGSIVNISSVVSKTAPANTAAYVSSKTAINGFSRSLALELAPHNIRVNAVCPGFIATSRMDDVVEAPDWEDYVKDHIPLGYPGDGSECAAMVRFLVSDRGKWITGQAINVDGGMAWGN